MTRAVLALAIAALVAGCGKYGPPVRSGAAGASGAGAAHSTHPADCRDPAHAHAGDKGDAAGAEAGAGDAP